MPQLIAAILILMLMIVIIWSFASLSISFTSYTLAAFVGIVSIWFIDYINRRRKKPLTIAGKILQSEERASLNSIPNIIIGLLIYLGITNVLEFSKPYNISMSIAMFTIIGFIGIVFIDCLLIKFRMKQGWYGTNTMEAIEIMRFLRKHSDNDDIGPRRIFRDKTTKSTSEETKDSILKPTSIP